MKRVNEARMRRLIEIAVVAVLLAAVTIGVLNVLKINRQFSAAIQKCNSIGLIVQTCTSISGRMASSVNKDDFADERLELGEQLRLLESLHVNLFRGNPTPSVHSPFRDEIIAAYYGEPPYLGRAVRGFMQDCYEIYKSDYQSQANVALAASTIRNVSRTLMMDKLGSVVRKYEAARSHKRAVIFAVVLALILIGIPFLFYQRLTTEPEVTETALVPLSTASESIADVLRPVDFAEAVEEIDFEITRLLAIEEPEYPLSAAPQLLSLPPAPVYDQDKTVKIRVDDAVEIYVDLEAFCSLLKTETHNLAKQRSRIKLAKLILRQLKTNPRSGQDYTPFLKELETLTNVPQEVEPHL